MIDDEDKIKSTNKIMNDDQLMEAFYYFTLIYNLCNNVEFEFNEVLTAEPIMQDIYPLFEQLLLDLTVVPPASNDNRKKT